MIPGLGRSPGEGKGYPLQCSGLENSMGCIVLGVTKSWTRLSDLHFHFHLVAARQWLEPEHQGSRPLRADFLSLGVLPRASPGGLSEGIVWASSQPGCSWALLKV